MGTLSTSHTVPIGMECFDVDVIDDCKTSISDLTVTVTIDMTYVSGLTLALNDPNKASITLLDRPGRDFNDPTGGLDGLGANLVGTMPVIFSAAGHPQSTFEECWPHDDSKICSILDAECDWSGQQCSFAPPVGQLDDLTHLVSAGNWQFCVTVDASADVNDAILTQVDIAITHV